MSVWALSDLHLAFGVPGKTMEDFGPAWENYTQKIETHCKRLISPQDLLLIPGDISWAMHLKDALIDLAWIDQLPGTKVILKGNHDYWWSSSSQLKKALPASIHFIHNNAFHWQGISIGGARLWDTSEYRFNPYIEFKENPRARQKTPQEIANAQEEEEKIFTRELQRLELSLQQLDPDAHTRIALTHYPPVGADLAPSRASAILEKYQIHYCVFGHLHSVKPHALPFGAARGVNYLFTSCDYLDFIPMKIIDGG